MSDAPPTVRRLLWVLLPGAVLHELTHAAAAALWGSYRIDWYREAPWWAWPAASIEMDFPDDAPGYAPLVAMVAPLVVGLALGLPVAYLVSVVMLTLWGYLLPMVVGGWMLVNIGYYLGASSTDIAGVRDLRDGAAPARIGAALLGLGGLVVGVEPLAWYVRQHLADPRVAVLTTETLVTYAREVFVEIDAVEEVAEVDTSSEPTARPASPLAPVERRLAQRVPDVGPTTPPIIREQLRGLSTHLVKTGVAVALTLADQAETVGALGLVLYRQWQDLPDAPPGGRGGMTGSSGISEGEKFRVFEMAMSAGSETVGETLIE
jgi:hypothetical protein